MPDSENSTSLIAMWYSYFTFSHNLLLKLLILMLYLGYFCNVNTKTITYMTTYGFSTTISTRVSNELGVGNIDRAKNVVTVTLKFFVFFALAIVLSLLFSHNIWANAFSNNPVIKKDFASMTPLAISILFDSTQGVQSGVARGRGWQHLAAWTNLVTFYCIGMPIVILLMFKVQLYAKECEERTANLYSVMFNGSSCFQ